jgi:hypothetical protein
MIISEVLIEGSYDYLKNDVNYSQENFKLIRYPDSQSYSINAEILTRVENGEFLKVIVRYEMNNFYFPNFVRIEKSLGKKYALEEYRLDSSGQQLKYHFNNSTGEQEINRHFNASHYLTSPAFSTSTIFTLSKKFNVSGRTGVILVGSDNDWNYQKPPEEKMLFAEFKSRELSDFKINEASLSASHLCLYEFDSSSRSVEIPVEIFISKYYGLPYQLVHGDEKIVIKNLRRID